MAKNYLQKGDTIKLTGTTAFSSDDPVAVGNLFGVAQADSIDLDGTNYDTEVGVEGVYELAVASALVVAIGDPLYWDVADGELNDDATNNQFVGIATQVSGNGDTTVGIRLNGFGILNP